MECLGCGIRILAPEELNVKVCTICEDTKSPASIARRKVGDVLHDLGVSLQFNCVTGQFEIVDQDLQLDIAVSNAVDKTGE